MYLQHLAKKMISAALQADSADDFKVRHCTPARLVPLVRGYELLRGSVVIGCLAH